MSNTVRLTLACFLAYFAMSGMLSPIGIVLPPLAERLNLPLPEVASVFSWLTLGILIGSALALVAFDLLSERFWMLVLYVVIAASILALYGSDSLWVLRLALGVIGCSCGIGLAAAASTITRLYDEDRRASMLVVTDASFSVAGILISTLAVACVAAGFHWASAYLAVGLFALVLVTLVFTAELPASPAQVPSDTQAQVHWPLSVWLCISALFLYTLGQYSLLWWLPAHLEETLGAPREQAGLVVSRFWTGMLLAQLLVAWWVLRIGARRLVLLSIIGTFLGSLPLWNSTSLTLLPWFALFWGVANLGLLKIVIAFATLAVPRPSSRLVAALLFGATSGTAISPSLTSTVVSLGDTRLVLQFGSLCYGVLAVLIFCAWSLCGRDGLSETLPESAGGL